MTREGYTGRPAGAIGQLPLADDSARLRRHDRRSSLEHDDGVRRNRLLALLAVVPCMASPRLAAAQTARTLEDRRAARGRRRRRHRRPHPGRGDRPRPARVTVVVENRPGAGTVIGTEAVARAAPDGETVLLTNPAFLINPHIKKVALRSADEFRSGLQHRELPAGVRRAGGLAAEDDGRHDRDGEGEAGLGHRGERRHRQPDPYRLRGAEEGDRPGDDLRAVPGAAPAVNALLGGHITRFIPTTAPSPGSSKAVRCGRSRSARKSASPGCRTCRPSPSSATPTTKRKAGTASSRRRRRRRTRSRSSIDWFSGGGNSARGEGEARRARDLPGGRVRRRIRRQPEPAVRAVRHRHPRFEPEGGVTAATQPPAA